MKNVFTVSSRLIVGLFVILFIALVNFGCERQTTSPLSSPGSENEQNAAAQMPKATMDDFAGIEKSDRNAEIPKCIVLPELPDWPTADFVVEEVTIQGDIIAFTLSYSGGCKPHDFQLVSTTFQGSDMPQVFAQLFHNNNNDSCEQWITEVRVFDLTPLKELYFNTYHTRCGTIVMNLVDEVPQDSRLTYQFCDHDDPIPPGPPLPPIHVIPNTF
jgi:hypothetical protein